MTLEEILHSKVESVTHTVGPDVHLDACVQMLCDHKIGGLPVLSKSGALIGIITERDILYAVQKKIDMAEAVVADCMTSNVLVGALHQDVEEAMQIMTHNRIRHLPIVHEHSIAGMVSIGDVVNSLLRQTADENQHLQSYITGAHY